MVEGTSIATGLNPLTDPIALFIIQLLLIVIISRVLGFLLSYLKQPPVISEVITGIILGPSVLGQSDKFFHNVFTAPSVAVLNVFANIGLIFFMFLIGLEVDANILKKNLKASLIISLTSIVVPFTMGIGLAALIHKYLPPAANHISFGLFLVFVGVAISITAFPVLARILNERNLMQSKVGVSSLAAASIDDVIAWILLAIVVAYGNNAKNGTSKTTLGPLWTFLMLLGFVLFCFFVVRWGLNYLYKRFVRNESHKHNFLILLLILALVSAFYTQVIGVHAIFGAFLLGICSPRIDGFHIYITERIEDIITIILLPLYFTYSGLRTSLSDINSGTAGGLTIFVIFVACIGKIGGATFASRFCGKGWRESLTIGFLMNTKGLVELIVLNIGLDIGVLTTQTFTMFVIMALVTTFMTTPVVHYLWCVHVEKKNHVPMAPKVQGSFNILLYISNTRIGSAMTQIAAAITPLHQTGVVKYKVKSLFPNNSSDRPSNYFFNVSFMNNIPPSKKESVTTIQNESLNVGVEFKPVFINSSNNVSDDISSISKRICPDIVLVGYTDENATQSIFPLSKSVEQFGESFYSKSISKTLQTCKSCIGVIVDKGLERFHRQHNLLFSYSGEEYENDALTIVFKMAKRANIKVTVITSCQEKLIKSIQSSPESIALQSFYIIDSPNPYKDTIEKSSLKESDYWMVIVGVSRDDAAKQERLVHSTQISLLIVHPSNQLLNLKSSTQNDLSESYIDNNNNNIEIELKDNSLKNLKNNNI